MFAMPAWAAPSAFPVAKYTLVSRATSSLVAVSMGCLARLYLKGPTPADATVRIILPGNRAVSGRIREILRIPMSSLRASAQVEIRAPGYRTYKSVVKLRAGGDLAEHSFALEREKETP